MLRTSLAAIGIVLASGGLALAQPSSPDAGPPRPPPKPAGHHHPPPPPPGGPAALQGKGFDLQLGHGRRLRVQCGDEPLKGCIQAAQPLIHQLAQSSRRGERHRMAWKHHHKPTGHGSMEAGSGMTNQGAAMKPGSSQGQEQTPSDTSGSSTQPDGAAGRAQ
ncbi:hypothetical protein [Salinisphaera sp. LB1]|uniref:hypothetical protein n=1 Tax=Salinisphaera sp. LB1 TaxID=2183911 RepID=UPI000D707430|nr:hypothetical protein [Salinisphaera sp. LB1]AWN16712.1 hypothetical protein SALB1_2514 [Salinisphaera sp. LB1]